MEGSTLPLLLPLSKRKKYFLNPCNLRDSHWSWGLACLWCCPETVGGPWGQETWKISCSVITVGRVLVPQGRGWTVLACVAIPMCQGHAAASSWAVSYWHAAYSKYHIDFSIFALLKSPCWLFCFQTKRPAVLNSSNLDSYSPFAIAFNFKIFLVPSVLLPEMTHMEHYWFFIV